MALKTLLNGALAKSEGDTRYVTPGYSYREIIGPSITNGTYMWGNPTARTINGTSRRGYTVLVAATDLQLTFGSWANNGTAVSTNFLDVDGTATATVSASIEISGTIYRVTVGGKISWTIDQGGTVTTDPLPVEVTAGTVIYVRTFMTGSSWFATAYSSTSSGSGGWVVTTDLTAPGSGAVADSSPSYLFMPIAITGLPLTSTNTNPVVLIMGDSIAHGTGDGGQTSMLTGINISNTNLGGGGFIQRALTTASIGSIIAAVPGDRVVNFILASGRFRRMRFARTATTAICEYGRNDVGQGTSLATIQADLITAWQLVYNAGLRVFQTTITPNSSSTDGWLTTGNQSGSGNNSTRISLNGWIRDGAPMSGGVAVATGTVGALRAGQTGHPLYGYFEIADLVETARDSNIWKAAVNTRTVTDAAINSGSFTLTSATANFTTADVGRIVAIAGAGTAGATLYTSISVRNSATSVSVFASGITTVSGASLTLGDYYTVDGTHPTSYGHSQAAAGIVTTNII